MTEAGWTPNSEVEQAIDELKAQVQKIYNAGYQQGRVASYEWTYDEMDDYYETACKNAYCLADGTLKDNKHKYCPYCGGLIQLAQQAQEAKGVGDVHK